MKKFYLLIFLLACKMFLAQNSRQYYGGIFYNHKNQPQNFLKIYNKNSGIYELTDDNGFAIIAAKAYDTLVWNNGKSKMVVSSYNLRELKTILEGQISNQYAGYIYSKSYDSLVSKTNYGELDVDNSFQALRRNSDKYFSSIRKIKIKKDSLYKMKEHHRRSLVINGSFTSSLDVKNRNSIPELQNKYVQGRSENGTLVWKGAETDELFSFGPDISSLGLDGSSYEYDQNGRLVNISNDASPAKMYNNSLFKTTVGFNNQLKVGALIKNGYEEKLRLSLEVSQQKNQMYFINQFDILNTFKAKTSGKILGFTINSGFSYDENKATNTNRTALFNRAYQNSLLTPVSFSNAQNIYLSSGLQRSYSRFADNPLFLFDQENKYNYWNVRRQFTFDVDKRWGDYKLKITQSYENSNSLNTDGYKPSTYGFTNGIINQRVQDNGFYNFNLLNSYEFGNRLKNIFSLNYILNDRKTEIDHSLGQKYLYQRTSQDYIFNYNMEYSDYRDFQMGMNVGNSFYISNTSSTNNYWLPKINAYVGFDDIFDWYRTNFKILGAYTQLSAEPEMMRSYSSYATTLLSAQNAYQYFPLEEAETFKNLSNTNVKEWKTGVRFSRRNNLNIEAEYFNRKITNDVFPVFEDNQLRLKNMADHTFSGYEVNLSYDIRSWSDFSLTHKISFFKYKDIVDRVNSGYNNLPVSGFNDIYKTLSEGQVLGAVMGSYFERNTDGKLIIDEFGFPKKAQGLKIIADPTPDFVVKFNHSINYKMVSLDINWEWKKGGQVWNGTQAVLDYYGRSFQSGEERDIKNYVFQGVNASGNINQIPVDFYDPNKDVNENRWTRYGYLGVAEDYVQKADYIRINAISLTTTFKLNDNYRRNLAFTLYINNIMLWQANKGVDPNQNFYDQDNGRGLDFFNTPSYKTFGCRVSFQF